MHKSIFLRYPEGFVFTNIFTNAEKSFIHSIIMISSHYNMFTQAAGGRALTHSEYPAEGGDYYEYI